MANKVKFGLSDVHYAKVTAVNATTGIPTYDSTWVALPYAISLTSDLETSTSSQYADNKKIYETHQKASYSIDLEFSELPDAFLKDVLGFKEATDGTLVEDITAKGSQIALAFKVKGDTKDVIRVFYLCSVADSSSDNANTNTDSVTFENNTLTLTAYAVPIGSNGVLAFKGKKEVTDSEATAFFSGTPALPTISA